MIVFDISRGLYLLETDYRRFRSKGLSTYLLFSAKRQLVGMSRLRSKIRQKVLKTKQKVLEISKECSKVARSF